MYEYLYDTFSARHCYQETDRKVPTSVLTASTTRLFRAELSGQRAVDPVEIQRGLTWGHPWPSGVSLSHDFHENVVPTKFGLSRNTLRCLFLTESKSFVDSQEISQERAQYGLYCYHVQLCTIFCCH
eukprot:g33673.t1